MAKTFVLVFKFEELADVVLCGHSYGGFVISGVAEQCAPAIASIVFLDAFVPNDGESMEAIAAPAVREVIQAAVTRGDPDLAPRSAEAFRVNAKDRAWVDALCRPQPLACFTEKIKLTGARERIAKKAYIRASGYANPSFDAALAQAKANPAWRSYEVACGHDVMVDMPERLTEILLEVA
jgi:pimeloyl-ACP methyl ester carboxylesterase